MNVLITGCAGLIGSNFSDFLVNKNINVIGIDNLSGGYLSNINNKVKFYETDLTEYDKVEEIFVENDITYVFHFAAYAAVGVSPFIRKFNYKNNLMVTTNLVNLAIKYSIKRFIFTSSMDTYGFGDNTVPFNEETTQNPIDPYGVAKLACEMDIKIAGNQHNLDYCIIRPHNVYGKKQNIWDKYRNVIGIWMYQLINNEPITIYGDGEQTRSFSYIDDILEPMWNAAVLDKSKNTSINLGSEKHVSLNNLALILSKLKNTDKLYLEKRHEVKHAWCTTEKSIQLLNFVDKTKLEDGIKIMWEWAKKQPNRERKTWKQFELDKNVYSYWKL